MRTHTRRRGRARAARSAARSAAITLLLVTVLACGEPTVPGTVPLGPGGPDLHVSAVQASAPVAGAAQLALIVENRGDGADRLLGAESDAALAIEIHRTVIDDDGRASMRMLDDVVIDAGTSVAFRPGGLHLMLVIPDERVRVGGTFEATLRFERTGPVMVTVPVVDLLDLIEGGAPGHRD